MIDLPFPPILNGEPEEQIQLIYNYLFQLKESMEFTIDNIGSDNLSTQLIGQIETIQSMIKSANESAEHAQSMAQKNGITVQDVVTSELFITTLQALETSVKGYTDTMCKSVENKIPTKVSQVENDKGFITKAVDDLTNYYTKATTYTKTEVNNLISRIPKFSIEVVESLPSENISTTTIYLVPSSESSEKNMYEEYIYVNNVWEIIGTQKIEIDLSEYYKKTEVDKMISDIKEYADEIKYNITINYVTGELEYTRTP